MSPRPIIASAGSDRLERQRRRRSRPEIWVLVQNGEETRVMPNLGDAMRTWEDLGHELPQLSALPHITRYRPVSDLTWLLERHGLSYEPGDGVDISCRLPSGRWLELWRDAPGWAWRSAAPDGGCASGALETYEQLGRLLSK